MAAGILLPSLLTIAASSTELLFFGDTFSNPAFELQLGPWKPPQYSKSAQTMLTVGATTDPNTGEVTVDATNYVFDAVFRISHRRSLKKTSHPVLTGVNISDHAYIEPAKVVLEIGMSDAMSSYDKSVWLGASSKSVAAFQVLKGLQTSKILVTLTTRLDTYLNMLVMEVQAPDDNKTNNSLRATVTLEEVISASVYATAPDSARPQTTTYSPSALVQPDDPSDEQVTNHQVLDSSGNSVLTNQGSLGLGGVGIPGSQAPGAGAYSSNSIYNVVTGTDQSLQGVP